MSSEEQPKIYKLTNRPQLIDLNGDLINFELEFLVKASDANQEFYAIVMTQDQLDVVDINKIEMKKAKGQIGGNINANNNKYQNYFLVLKKVNETEEESEVQVLIKINPLEVLQSNESPSILPSKDSILSREIEDNSKFEKIPFYRKSWFLYLLLAVAILLCLYFYYRSYYKTKVPKINQNQTQAPLVSDTEIYNQLQQTVE